MQVYHAFCPEDLAYYQREINSRELIKTCPNRFLNRGRRHPGVNIFAVSYVQLSFLLKRAFVVMVCVRGNNKLSF